MKVTKLSKFKSKTNKNTKHKTKIKKCINRLKGGEGDDIQRLNVFIQTLKNKVNTNNIKNKYKTQYETIKILTYFDIKIILLYIVAYDLLKLEKVDKLQQIFRWFSYVPEIKKPFIMYLLTNNEYKDSLLTLIYNYIKEACINNLIKFEFNNSQYKEQFNEQFNEHDAFTTYLTEGTVITTPDIKNTDLNKSKPMLNQMSRKTQTTTKQVSLTQLLGDTNYLHFIINYLKYFNTKGHLTNNNITNNKNSNLIDNNTKKKLSNINTIISYSDFVNICNLIINSEKNPLHSGNTPANTNIQTAETQITFL